METIERIMIDSDLTFSEKHMVAELFRECWREYYENGTDTHFETVELRDFWFLYKMLMLCELADGKNMKPIYSLRKEINRNATRYLNHNYTVKDDKEYADQG